MAEGNGVRRKAEGDGRGRHRRPPTTPAAARDDGERSRRRQKLAVVAVASAHRVLTCIEVDAVVSSAMSRFRRTAAACHVHKHVLPSFFKLMPACYRNNNVTTPHKHAGPSWRSPRYCVAAGGVAYRIRRQINARLAATLPRIYYMLL